MSLTNPSREETRYMGACKRLGCTVCIIEGFGPSPCDFHHMLRNGKRIGHLMGFGLCSSHHSAGVNTPACVSRHPWKAAFERRYGSEASLLQKTRELLKRSS